MSARSTWLALLAGCLLLLGCAGAPTAPSASPLPTPTEQPTTASPATAPSPSLASPAVADITVGGDRPVTVTIPPGLDPTVPAPLLMMLHGFGGTGDRHEQYLRLGQAAAANGMLYVRPTGTRDADGETFWNATDACCDVDRSGVDDSSYLAGLIKEISTHVAVDPRRVYVVGHSNGGFMSFRMACDHADTIAAIVSLAGASFVDPKDCRPSEPVAIVDIHGTADEVVKPAGGNLRGILAPGDDGFADYPSTEASLRAWAGYDGCSGQPTTTPEALDLDAGLRGPSGPKETTVSAYGSCAPGGAAESWMIQGGGHDPALAADFGATVIDWLLAHPKPGT